MKKLPTALSVISIAAAPAAAQNGKAAVKDKFSIYFDKDSTALTPSAKSLIKSIVKKFPVASNHAYYIQGHTDRRLSKDQSLLQSAKTAGAVYRYFSSLDISDNSLATMALGESSPAKATLDGISEPLNRRVEIKVYYIPPK